MARILLGWELGANRGHLVRLGNLARRLAAAGHDVAIAAQRLSRAFDFPDGATLWQAPVWPRLLSNVGALGGAFPNTMGDILVRVGLDSDDALPSLIQGWDAILAAVRPDVVVADFAPALLCAARGRCPTLTVGIGFYVVPPALPAFPSLTGQHPVFPEAEVLERVNRETGTIVAIITHNAAIAGMADRVVRVSSGTIASIQRNARRISPSELAW